MEATFVLPDPNRNIQKAMQNDSEWDVEVVGFDPQAAASNKYVIRYVDNVSKAERRNFRDQERQRLHNIEDTKPKKTDKKVAEIVNEESRIELRRPLSEISESKDAPTSVRSKLAQSPKLVKKNLTSGGSTESAYDRYLKEEMTKLSLKN